MNKRRLHKTILLLLVLAAAILLLAGVVAKPGIGKSVLMYLVIALGVGAMIEALLFAMKPGWYRDKVDKHPEEMID